VVRGHVGEGRDRLAALLARAADGATPGPQDTRRSPGRVSALYAATQLAYLQGRYPEARAMADESLRLARELGDRRAVGHARVMAGAITLNQGDYGLAETWAGDGLALGRELDDRILTMRGLHVLAVVARLRTDYPRALALDTECRALLHDQGDLWYLTHVLSGMGLASYHQGARSDARARFEESLAIRRGLRDAEGTAWSLINLGDVDLAEGDHAAARSRYGQSLAVLRRIGDRSGTADALASLGHVSRAEGDHATAHARYRESLAIRRELGHRIAMPSVLESLAGLVAGNGDAARALRLAGAAAALRHSLGGPLSPREHAQLEDWLHAARQELGATEAARAWEDGEVTPIERTVDDVLNGSTTG
jgi:tetratricopeptide (TPR) repeat protein